MRILVIGSGGREHALAWKLSQSPHCERLFCAPGNPGIGEISENTAIDGADIDGLCRFAKENSIGLTVVGPEAPLVAGIVDRFQEEGLKVFGPRRAAAQLEGSKAFTKEFLAANRIPTAAFRVFDQPEEACAYIQSQGAPIVVKADGLAAGKGVVVASSTAEALRAINEIMVDRVFGPAGDRVVVEECLTGDEISILAFCDGKHVLPLDAAQDHKRVYDNDRGPNTGGMGAYSPAAWFSAELRTQATEKVLRPAVEAMAKRGMPYKGLLYAGLMFEGGRSEVLEFNVRFGDPETQPLMMRLESDLVEIMMACIGGTLDQQELRWSPQAAVCVVCASEGYPGPYPKGRVITGIAEAEALGQVKVFHAGTTVRDGNLVTSGGRVLNVTALGKDFEEARARAYQAVGKIHFEGMHYRKDIGARARG